MGYELHIRSGAPDKPIAQPALAASLDALQTSGVPEVPVAAAVPTPAAAPAQAAAPTSPPTPTGTSQNPGPWSLKNGKGSLEVRLFLLDGALRGADFDVPFGGSEDELRRAFACVVQCAEAFGAIVFDPQLGREVGRGAADDVVGRWRQSQDWMVDVAGTYDDRRSLAEFTQPPPLINRSSKILLIIIGGFIALYWLIGTIADFLH